MKILTDLKILKAEFIQEFNALPFFAISALRKSDSIDFEIAGEKFSLPLYAFELEKDVFHMVFKLDLDVFEAIKKNSRFASLLSHNFLPNHTVSFDGQVSQDSPKNIFQPSNVLKQSFENGLQNFKIKLAASWNFLPQTVFFKEAAVSSFDGEEYIKNFPAIGDYNGFRVVSSNIRDVQKQWERVSQEEELFAIRHKFKATLAIQRNMEILREEVINFCIGEQNAAKQVDVFVKMPKKLAPRPWAPSRWFFKNELVFINQEQKIIVFEAVCDHFSNDFTKDLENKRWEKKEIDEIANFSNAFFSFFDSDYGKDFLQYFLSVLPDFLARFKARLNLKMLYFTPPQLGDFINYDDRRFEIVKIKTVFENCQKFLEICAFECLGSSFSVSDDEVFASDYADAYSSGFQMNWKHDQNMTDLEINLQEPIINATPEALHIPAGVSIRGVLHNYMRSCADYSLGC